MFGIPVATIDDSQDGRVAAIGTLEDHRAVAFGRIFRLDGNEVRGELDFAIPQVYGVGEIDDASIVLVRDRERDIDTTGDSLVGPGVAEGLAVGDVGARYDLDVRDLGRQRQRQHEPGEREQETQRTGQFHGVQCVHGGEE